MRIERGTIHDYDALARFHYCGGRPATRVLVLRAVEGGVLAGVLVVSMPTLNGWWRARAWPGRYGAGGGGKARAAARLNREVRTISRVVVDPRFRGLGVGAALVRAYLRRPLTRRTEAVATMGEFCPLFERAGMTRVGTRPTRLPAGVSRLVRGPGAWRVMDVGHAARLLRSCAPARRALRAWGRGARATRRLALRRGSLRALLVRAARIDMGGCGAYVADRCARPRRGRTGN
jgi:GNAT superfamily N-acetyltransferase